MSFQDISYITKFNIKNFFERKCEVFYNLREPREK